MSSSEQAAQIYQELAEHFERENKPRRRDVFLLLAADAALKLGQEQEAERLRLRLLHYNPHHMLKPYYSFAEAMEAPDVKRLLGELQEEYPLERAQELLDQCWEIPLSDDHDDDNETTAHMPQQELLSLGSPGVPVTEPAIDLDREMAKQSKRTVPPVIPMKRAKPPATPPSPRAPSDDSDRAPTVLNRDGAAPPAKKSRKPVPRARPADPLDQEIPPTLPLGTAIPELDRPRPVSRRVAPAPEPVPQPGDELQGGAWFSTILFFLALFGFLMAIIYFLAEPFLPDGF